MVDLMRTTLNAEIANQAIRANKALDNIRSYDRMQRYTRHDSLTGFDAVAYQSPDKSHIVVGFGGSATAMDFYTDLIQTQNPSIRNIIDQVIGNQLDQAKALVGRIADENPGVSITTTGFSLGGIQAQYAINNSVKEVYTFDSPGILGIDGTISQAFGYKNRLTAPLVQHLYSDPAEWSGLITAIHDSGQLIQGSIVNIDTGAQNQGFFDTSAHSITKIVDRLREMTSINPNSIPVSVATSVPGVYKIEMTTDERALHFYDKQIDKPSSNSGTSNRGGGSSSNNNNSGGESEDSGPSTSTTTDKSWGGWDNDKEGFGNDFGDKTFSGYNDDGTMEAPVLLDISGKGLSVDSLTVSQRFLDLDGDGYQRRTAWAGTGTGVLVFDADGDGKISRSSEFAFTEWDKSAGSDLEALRRVFDTNNNNKLDAGDSH